MFKKCCVRIGIGTLLLATGCTKGFDLKLDETEPLIVIQGRISNLQGPYQVRITKSSNLIALTEGYSFADNDSAEAVTGAEVIISDDMGTIDTLKPAYSYNVKRYNYYYYKSNNTGIFDSVFGALPYNYANKYRGEQGYYETTKITGRPGHTYRLQVRIGNEVFHASAYMPFVPELDSALLKETTVNGNDYKAWLPYAYFKEPQNEKNYYHLSHNPIYDYPYDNPWGQSDMGRDFPFYVVDDAILPAYVNGLAAQSLVPSHNFYEFNGTIPHTGKDIPVQLRLSSLTKEAYEFFRVLTMHLEDDGNAYKPAPASAKGNISGNALGLFWASHISHKLILP